MPPQKQLAQLRSVGSLATLWCASVRTRIPSGPVVLAGIGAGGVVAHEMAVQMQRSGQQVGGCMVTAHAAITRYFPTIEYKAQLTGV